MPQDQGSGAKASRWGHITAQAIAAQLGARNIRRASNECELDGERIVIKCAAVGTRSVGVTYKMLERLERIVGAFELGDGSFELWSITPAQFSSAMRDTRSQGMSKGKVGLVERSYFQQHGQRVGRTKVATAG